MVCSLSDQSRDLAALIEKIAKISEARDPALRLKCKRNIGGDLR